MNLWKRLNEITGQREPVFVGEVVAINATLNDVRCTMQVLPGTGTVEVLAPGRALELGQRWVVQGGRIVEEAPTTEVLEIEI
jgi:hypothetical protein